MCFILKIKEKSLTGTKIRTRSNSHRLLYSWNLTHLVSEGTFEVFSAKGQSFEVVGNREI